MSIGQILAEARHQAGLTVEAVSERTRIRPPVIRGIEADDYSVCGGDFYARGDIRSIARAVGADPEPLVREYDTDHRDTAPVAATSLDELLARSRPERRRRADWPLVLALALVTVVGLGAYAVLARPMAGGGHAAATADQASGAGQGGRQLAAGPGKARGASRIRGQASPGAGRTASPAADPRSSPPGRPVRTLTAVRATAFGPGGPGSGDGPQRAPLAIDRRPGTAWRTDWYTTPRFGHLYAGTGLLLDLGHRVTVTKVVVALGPAAGVRFQIRVGHAPALRALRPVARSSGRGGVVRLRLASPAQGRYVLVWFTRLPRDPAGTFRVAVHNVRVRGRG